MKFLFKVLKDVRSTNKNEFYKTKCLQFIPTDLTILLL